MADQAPTTNAPAPDAQAAPSGAIATVAPTTEPAATHAVAPDATQPAPEVVGQDATSAPTEPATASIDADDGAPLTDRQGRLAARLARAQSELRKVGATAKQLEELQTLARENPQGVLEKLGISFEDLVLRVAGEQKPVTVDDEVAELKRWKAEREQAEAEARKQAETAQRERAIEQATAGVAAELEREADKFPLIIAKGAADQVFDGMVRYIEKYGEIEPSKIPVLRNRVAAEIEKALEETTERELTALFEKAPKLVGRVSSRYKTQGQPTTSARQEPAPTLTSTSQTGGVPPTKQGGYSPEETDAIVARILRGEMQSPV